MYVIPVKEVEDYCPPQMIKLWTKPWDDTESPVRLKPNISDDTLSKVPFLNMTLHLLHKIEEKGEIKLTANGNFPVALCKELYALCPMDDRIENGICKLRSEIDTIELMILHSVVEHLGWVKLRHGKLSLTARGKKILPNRREILRQLLVVFCSCGVSDYYDHGKFNNLNRGAAFLFILFHKYGNNVRPSRFYVQKYIPACFELQWIENYDSAEAINILNYPIYKRLIERFAQYFGVIKIDTARYDPIEEFCNGDIEVTPLLHELIDIDEPENASRFESDLRFS